MRDLKFTLLCDGSSDKVLVPIIEWMLRRHLADVVWNSEVADLSVTFGRPRTLHEKIESCFELYPADVLFIHRDAERDPPSKREKEIEIAKQQLTNTRQFPYTVPVIPVRMTEAWLLISEYAIRRASGNPNGRVALHLPPINDLESLPDPKSDLERFLKIASERSRRMLKKFHFPVARQNVPDFISDWSPLLQLSSAQMLDQRIQQLAREI